MQALPRPKMALAYEDHVARAALNLALLDRAICAVHHRASQLTDAAWYCTLETPPHTPQMIALGGTDKTPQHRRLVQEIMERGVPGRWLVGDSFAAMELELFGFRKGSSRSWVRKEALAEGDAIELGPGSERQNWERVSDEERIAEWEDAWLICTSKTGGRTSGKRRLPPGVLQLEGVQVLEGRLDGKIVSGCVANVGAEVVGLANLFLPHGQERDKWRSALIAKVHSDFPGLPVVGHAHGEDLLGLISLGFHEIGKMRLWERDAD